MTTRFSYLKRGALIAASLGMFATAFAKMEQWADTQGNTFKAEASEVIGPLALFRLPNRAGKLLPLTLLSPQDCVRFSKQTASLPEPAADWFHTKTAIGSEIVDNVLRLQGERLVPADLKGKPEPRFYVLFFVNNGESKSWDTLGKSLGAFQDLQQKFPGMVEGLMFGIKHTPSEHNTMAIQMKVPYLVASAFDEAKMEEIGRLVPSVGYGIVICTGRGVPLFPPSRGDTEESAKKVMADFAGLLALLSPSNPRTWSPRLHYWKAVQPALYAADKCEPLLVGDPLNVGALAQRGIKSFEATLFVSAEGAVTGVSMAPGGEIPDELRQPIAEALQQAQFVPAVDSGKFVAGKKTYRFGEK